MSLLRTAWRGVCDSARLLLVNWKALVGFELLYRLLTLLVFGPVFYLLFRLSLWVSGVGYLSTESLRLYLRHPMSLLLLLLALLTAVLVRLFDMLAVAACLQAARHGESLPVLGMLRAGAVGMGRLRAPRNWPLLLLPLWLGPLARVVTISGRISLSEAPEFLLDYVLAQPLLAAVAAALVVAFFLLALRRCLCLAAFAFEGRDALPARRRSFALMKRRTLTTAAGLALWYLLVYLAAMVVMAAFSVVAVLGVKLLAPPIAGYPLAAQATLAVGQIVLLLTARFSTPLLLARLCTVYEQACRAGGENTPPPPRHLRVAPSPARKRVAYTLLAIAIAANVGLFVYHEVQDLSPSQALLRLPDISAHRGSSTRAPENSLPAFEQAIADDADWIELDVHQTRDGVVMVCHDADLKRIAGSQKNIWELTYDELQQYDVGSWFSTDFAGLRMATLDEVLALCKGKIKLNIELKPTGHEENFEENVVELVRQHGFVEDCVLASLNAGSLARVEELAPEIGTVYIMALALGDYLKIPYVDGYSVEYSFLSRDLLDRAAQNGKFVFVWTLNRPKHVIAARELGVENIITDNPLMVRQALYDSQLNDNVSRLLVRMFPRQKHPVAPRTLDMSEHSV